MTYFIRKEGLPDFEQVYRHHKGQVVVVVGVVNHNTQSRLRILLLTLALCKSLLLSLMVGLVF